jgi:hypothetical protein
VTRALCYPGVSYVLKCVEREGVSVRSGLKWLRIRSSGGFYEHGDEPYCFAVNIIF